MLSCFCSVAWLGFVFVHGDSMQSPAWKRLIKEGETSLPGGCFASIWFPMDLCLHNEDVVEKCL